MLFPMQNLFTNMIGPIGQQNGSHTQRQWNNFDGSLTSKVSNNSGFHNPSRYNHAAWMHQGLKEWDGVFTAPSLQDEICKEKPDY